MKSKLAYIGTFIVFVVRIAALPAAATGGVQARDSGPVAPVPTTKPLPTLKTQAFVRTLTGDRSALEIRTGGRSELYVMVEHIRGWRSRKLRRRGSEMR
ncbi:hypothetical protein PM082_020993 [Marasmius tenuissimus]|nr:hypothetical protein PM082_020993 [Marasmius tenuissimus]